MTTCRYVCGGLLSPVSHNVGCGLSPFKPLMHAVMHAWTHPSSAGTQEHTSRGAYRTYEPYVKRGAAAGRGSSTASAATCASRLWYCTFESTIFHELQQLRAHELIEHFNRSHQK